MEELRQIYSGRGVNLVCVASRWTFRTAEDLSWLLASDGEEKRKLSRAATETLAIIAYHQPVTRADIEEISRRCGVERRARRLDGGRLGAHARPPQGAGPAITYGTTTDFLIEFGLEAIADLPGLDELQGAGLFEGKLPSGYGLPDPNDEPALRSDEEPLGEPTPLDRAWGPISPDESA